MVCCYLGFLLIWVKLDLEIEVVNDNMVIGLTNL